MLKLSQYQSPFEVERKLAVSVSEDVRKGMAEGSWIRRMFEESAVLKQQFGAENVFDLSG